MNLLVLGANGMAGRMISTYFMEKGNEVTGFDRNAVMHCTRGMAGDALDKDTLVELVASDDYDAVINCIGLLNQFAEENHALAAYLNGYLPHFLADLTKNSRARVLHMSTDCVFSGKRGGYTEKDLRDGETFYDRSKALGELEDDKNLTLRGSIVGPDSNPHGIGLLNWFMQQNGSVRGFTKAMWTGQTTLQVAKTMEAAINAGATGLVNTVPDTSISKYDMLKLFNHYLRNDEVDIQPYDDFVADKSLVRTNNDFDYRIPDYETMIAELAVWMREHKALYPHYKL